MFHATSVELNVGDCLLPSEKNGKIYGTKEEFQCLIFGRNNDSLRDLGSLISTLPLKNGKLGIKLFQLQNNIRQSLFKTILKGLKNLTTSFLVKNNSNK